MKACRIASANAQRITVEMTIFDFTRWYGDILELWRTISNIFMSYFALLFYFVFLLLYLVYLVVLDYRPTIYGEKR